MYNLVQEKFKFRDFKKALMNFRNLLLLIFSRFLNISRNKLYILILQITCFKMIYTPCLKLKNLKFEIFSNFKN